MLQSMGSGIDTYDCSSIDSGHSNEGNSTLFVARFGWIHVDAYQM